MPAIVAPPVVTPFTMSWIENVSGSFAAPWTGVRSAPSSTRPLAGDGRRGDGKPPPPRLRGHLRNNLSPGRAGRQLSPGLWEADYLGHRGYFQEPKHDPKRVLVPSRLRRPPATGWSWVDRRFLREYAERLSREAVLLYFFLTAVADQNGLSFYGDGTLAALLRIPLPALVQARDELLAHDLIAHEVRLTQVLSLPPPGQRRRSEPGQGLLQLGEILRQVIAQPHSSKERGES
jgi:hypothetical protein